ncbi:hypothetical protein [Streptomyces sp. NPDC059168]
MADLRRLPSKITFTSMTVAGAAPPDNPRFEQPLTDAPPEAVNICCPFS